MTLTSLNQSADMAFRPRKNGEVDFRGWRFGRGRCREHAVGGMADGPVTSFGIVWFVQKEGAKRWRGENSCSHDRPRCLGLPGA